MSERWHRLAVASVVGCLLAAGLTSQLPTQAAEDARRVELPRAGLAVSYPEGWRLEATPVTDDWLHTAHYLWSHQSCQMQWFSGPTTSEAVAERSIAWADANGLDVIARTELSLPAGDVVHVEVATGTSILSNYWVDVRDGVVAWLRCAATAPPEDRWLPIAETIEVIPVEEGSASGPPLTRRFEFDARVELPEVGVAVDLPAEWWVHGDSRALPWLEDAHTVLFAWSEDASSRIAFCRLDDFSRVFGSCCRHTIEDMQGSVVDATPSAQLLDSTYLDLPVGRSGRVAYTDPDGSINRVAYSLTDGDTWLQLACSAETPPEDSWLSIAETLEFLPAEE